MYGYNIGHTNIKIAPAAVTINRKMSFVIGCIYKSGL